MSLVTIQEARFLLSVVVHNGIVFAANCGQSAILCCTSKNNLLQLAVPHTTDNQS